MLKVLTQIQYPNITNILNIYYYDNKLWVISEYIDVLILNLEFKRLGLEEWEIIIIIREVKFFKSPYTI